VAKTRSYTVELESSPLGAALSDAVLDAFAAALTANRKLAGPVPSADLERGRLELRTGVDASGSSNALAIVEVAFLRAAEKAGLKVEVAEASIWADDESLAPRR
jgi:hypothetical protein